MRGGGKVKEGMRERDERRREKGEGENGDKADVEKRERG